MFSQRDLRFVLCSRDLELRAQRIIFYLIDPQINEGGFKSDHVVIVTQRTVTYGLTRAFSIQIISNS